MTPCTRFCHPGGLFPSAKRCNFDTIRYIFHQRLNNFSNPVKILQFVFFVSIVVLPTCIGGSRARVGGAGLQHHPTHPNPTHLTATQPNPLTHPTNQTQPTHPTHSSTQPKLNRRSQTLEDNHEWGRTLDEM